jgi:DNA (cytosine-5)-methyltransferase 1
MTFGSLFAGIGGFDLGFERAGMTCKWQVEIDPYCQRVLAKHWPDVRRHDDVRTFPPTDADEWRVDVICGGFPCQGVSRANHAAAGLEDSRSGLWMEYARVVRLLRPRFVVVENAAELTYRGLETILGDFAACGFDAEWAPVSASQLGAPHTRQRIFVVAYANRESGRQANPAPMPERAFWPPRNNACRSSWNGRPAVRRLVSSSDVLRMADGVPNRMDRLSGTGNAVCPDVAEYIGRRLIEAAPHPATPDLTKE